jgi:hypothetical protein
LNPRKSVRELVLGPARVLLGRVAEPETLLADTPHFRLRAES